MSEEILKEIKLKLQEIQDLKESSEDAFDFIDKTLLIVDELVDYLEGV